MHRRPPAPETDVATVDEAVLELARLIALDLAREHDQNAAEETTEDTAQCTTTAGPAPTL